MSEDLQFAENDLSLIEPNIINYVQKRVLLANTKILKQSWSVLEVFQKIKERRLILDPNYQRNDVWKKQKMIPFIESLFMGIAIPPLYVVEIPAGPDILEQTHYEVVDGKQRLLTIQKFLSDGLKLEKDLLEYFGDWFNGKTFKDISYEFNAYGKQFLSSVLDIYVITANSPDATKYDIFSRLNKGSEPLKVNEIRKAIYQSPVMEKIEAFVTDKQKGPEYKRIFSSNDIKRYEDYGRFFRSIAFYLQSNIEDKIINDYNSRPRDMINNVLIALQRNPSLISEDILFKILDKTIELIIKIPKTNTRGHMIDACIKFAVDEPVLFNQKFDQIFKDEEIKDTFTKSATTTTNTNNRFARVINILHFTREE